ncbi:hypothetical protein K458DRAFT_417140 [Lentithecium fluviatile CBS 122367]|uniref:Uncharacterized protein n=1 Tax=Lentithecium fluviatile CBS 122367 TaxID=1168545 RepID=A0A6G1J3D1_9PLEO|nr:hypothetical protein K458DRAFT_417140 [Lentithecium fluviatile CBS 122367]
MASTNRGIKTYHVVPRFDMAADGGPLFLGAIFRDLAFLRPALNRQENTRIKVREELKYTPITQVGFRETQAKIREGSFEAWVKVLSGLGGAVGGGSANVSRSSDTENTVACEEIVTTYFDPDDKYLADSFAVEPVQKYLEGSRGWTTELYLITGLKVAKKLEYNKSNTSQGRVSGQLASQDPHGTAAGAGVDANLAGKNRHQIEFIVADVVVGYRVNKYRCMRQFFGKDRKINDDGVLVGEMMADKEARAKQPQVQYEAVPIPEEAAGADKASGGDAYECWIVPKA